MFEGIFGKGKRQIKNVTFVQPLQGEAYFYTPIGYSINLQSSNEKKGKQVFDDSDLALAGKLKLIFEREKMSWFEIREEKSPTPEKGEYCFVLYYYPHRLVVSRTPSLDEKATLQDMKEMFDFIVTEDQTRFAEVQQMQSLSAYGYVAGEPHEESESISIVPKGQIRDLILQTVKKEKPETAKQLIALMQEHYAVPPQQTNDVVMELENEDLLNFTGEEPVKGALSQPKIGIVQTKSK
jgi:hypothetical protein